MQIPEEKESKMRYA